MKYILTFILISLSTFLCAQSRFPRVDKIEIEDRVLHGRIDKYPITIYLKFNRYSNCHTGVYSLKGWYYYDKIKTKIPLTGLYEYNELTLYNFQDTSKTNELLNFREMKENHWEDMKYYKNLLGYNEKFVLNDSAFFWTDNKKTFDVSLIEEDFTIKKTHELLFLDSTKAFDLHNLGNWPWNFQIVAKKN
ncbi:hypothetical protein ACXR6G_06935 [Ancylomarina sp. YFZ004]